MSLHDKWRNQTGTMKLGEHVILQPKAPAVPFTDLTIVAIITVEAFSYTDFCIHKLVPLSLI